MADEMIEPGPALDAMRDLHMFVLDMLMAHEVISASDLGDKLAIVERQALVDQLRPQAELFAYAQRYVRKRQAQGL